MMPRFSELIVFLALVMQAVSTTGAVAQPASPSDNRDIRDYSALQSEYDILKKKYDEAIASNEVLSQRTVELIQQLRKATSLGPDPEIHKIDVTFYERWAEHNLRVFQMTLIESTILLVVVLAVVGSGLYFSYMQLRTAMTAGRTTVEPPAADGSDAARPKPGPSPLDPATNLELSATGVKITSSIAGVIILAMSLGFFYLYLKEVYPIKLYGSTAGASSASAGPQPTH
jgi:hypothetical protein